MTEDKFFEQVYSLKEQLKFSGRFSIDFDKINNIVVCGMGGSGVSGRIFSEYFKDKPVLIIDTYDLPAYVNKKSFFVAISYSGNTEEVLSVVKEAREKGIKIHSITSGGELERLSDQVVKVPSGLQPRAAIGYLLMPLFNTFTLKNSSDISETISLLNEIESNRAFIAQLAQRITDSGKIPYILAWEPFSSLSYRFKTQFNENSKMFALNHVLSEQNHNELVPMLMNEEMRTKFFYLVVEGYADSRSQSRMNIVEEESHLEFYHLKAKGETVFQKLFYLLHFIDLLTVHIAIKNSFDPEDVRVLENLKKNLKTIK
jgi:bifunctional phosphoglucose/phosphomannose isomerase